MQKINTVLTKCIATHTQTFAQESLSAVVEKQLRVFITQCMFLTFLCVRVFVCVGSCVYCPMQGTESEVESFNPNIVM